MKLQIQYSSKFIKVQINADINIAHKHSNCNIYIEINLATLKHKNNTIYKRGKKMTTKQK